MQHHAIHTRQSARIKYVTSLSQINHAVLIALRSLPDRVEAVNQTKATAALDPALQNLLLEAAVEEVAINRAKARKARVEIARNFF